VLALIAVASLFIPDKQVPEESREAEPFVAFAGGYPVPPMPVSGADSSELKHRGGKR
jgi:NADH-quinone oxidoreductase subunit H